MYKFFRKYHKWSGIILMLFLIFFSLSGIILNHRETLARFEISRTHLNKDYKYNNWNNAAVLEMLPVSADTILWYGNIGVWQTDSSLTKFNDLNAGFTKGIDNRKIFKIIRYKDNLYAGSLYGFYTFDSAQSKWQKLTLPVREKNVVDMLVKGDTLFVLTRSYLLQSNDGHTFAIQNLPAPEGYDNKLNLFKTMWVIHSGEIYGIPGKLIVDVIALVMIFLSVTGIILFLSKKKIKKNKDIPERKKKYLNVYRWNIKWHNKIGWITVVFLLITTFTGMFLRPPLLVAIADARVSKIPFTQLDTPNPWYDILRRIIYLPQDDIYVIATFDGFYYADSGWTKIEKFSPQPPASVMGVTVLKDLGDDKLLIGSFEGLFEWNYKQGDVYDVMKKIPYEPPVVKGPPVGDYKISGYGFNAEGESVVFDYSYGALGVNGPVDFPEMPAEVLKKSPISLWNFSLEVHTGRFFKPIFGIFYILIVPLVGIFTLVCLIAGFIIWWRFYRKSKTGGRRKNRKKKNNLIESLY